MFLFLLHAGLKFEPGVLGEVFNLMKSKVELLNEKEKKCVLMLDEMAIVPKVEYDSSTGSIRGYSTLQVPSVSGSTLATHALVIMIAGVSSRWKQVVGYHYTGL